MKHWLAALVVATGPWHAVARSLRSGTASLSSGEELLLDLDLEGCQANPSSCGGAVDVLANLSSGIIAKTEKVLNQTRDEVALVVKEFVKCQDQTKASTHKKTVEGKAKKHKECREQQKKGQGFKTQCDSDIKTQAATKNTDCGAPILTTQEPAKAVCVFTEKMTLASLKAHYDARVTAFKKIMDDHEKQKGLCTNSTKDLTKLNADCKKKSADDSSKRKTCDGELKSLEEQACVWAQNTEDRCKSYDKCYAAAKTKLDALRTSTKAVEQSLKGEYMAGKTMECMGKAIDKSGKVDAKKMKACKNSTVDSSHLAVTVPELPKEMNCWQPTIYPGSRVYRKMVYTGLPEGVDVALPQPCLGWKGGCAAKSTFDGSVVHLKRDGKRCGSDDSGFFRCDGTLQGEFKFVNQKAPCSSAKLVAVKKGGVEESCSFAPDTEKDKSKDHVRCAVKASKYAKTEVEISSNQAAAGRVGKVTLKFAPLSTVAMNLSAWSAKTELKSPSDYKCANGALSSLMSEKDNSTADRSWQHRCRTFPPGAGQGGAITWPAKFNDFSTTLDMQCQSGEVLAGHKSEKDRGKKSPDTTKDRKFKFGCMKLPTGVFVRQDGEWSAWTAWKKDWELKCAGDEVIVGLKSEHAGTPQNDRRWKCKCAKLAVRAPQSITFDVDFVHTL